MLVGKEGGAGDFLKEVREKGILGGGMAKVVWCGVVGSRGTLG